MKAATALLVCVVAVFTYTTVDSIRVRRQLIPPEFANINVEEYLRNTRAVVFQIKCIVYNGPCDNIGKYMKVAVPQVLQNQCQNCKPEERKIVGRMISHIQQNFPKEWADAVRKFQGGKMKPEDAKRLEDLYGVKLEPEYVDNTSTASPFPAGGSSAAEKSTTSAPYDTTSPVASTVASENHEADSDNAAPAVSSSAAPVVVLKLSPVFMTMLYLSLS